MTPEANEAAQLDERAAYLRNEVDRLKKEIAEIGAAKEFHLEKAEFYNKRVQSLKKAGNPLEVAV